jgi:hypothetical protein
MLKQAVQAVVATLIASSLLAAPAHASAGRDARICLPVSATGVGQDNGDFTTTATITSHGIPLGTTHATFTPTGGDATTVTFSGPIKFTTYIGTLTAEVDGFVNLTTGVFGAASTSVRGTGAFRGVTGDLTFAGLENLQTGAFTETITGRLCVRLPF